MPTTTAELETKTENRDPGRWLRRAITIPAMYLAALIGLALFPIALPLGFLVDLARRRKLALSRCVIFFAGYLAGEAAFITLCGLQWLAAPGFTAGGRKRLARWAQWLSRGWGWYLDRFGRRCFSVDLDVTGREALEGGGPAIVFFRHVSVADNLFAPNFISIEGGFDLRYVAKRELQFDPIFDLIGNRMTSCFVRRESGNAQREIAEVVKLLDDMGPKDAIVLWPEGTRFSAGKRARILEALEKRGDAALLARAKGLNHVLPPRLGGPIALLEDAVDRGLMTDVIFVEHAGFEGAATFADLLSGRAIGRRVRVNFERVPFSKLPRGRAALTEWFYARWEHLDRWVGEELPKVIAKAR